MQPSTPLEYRAYADEAECAAAFQWGFAHHVEVRHPSIRVLGASRLIHEALDRWDARPERSGLTLDDMLDEAVAHAPLTVAVDSKAQP